MGESWLERTQKAVWNWMDHVGDTRPLTSEEKRQWEEKNKSETTYHKSHVIAGICDSPTLSQVKDLMNRAAWLTDKAKKAEQFTNSRKILGQAGDNFIRTAAALDEYAKTGKEVVGKAIAACEISNAISILNAWSNGDPAISVQDAANAFDRLFGGTADYVGSLPPPACWYAKLFSAIRDYNFFSNMQKQLDFVDQTDRRLKEQGIEGY